MENIKRKLERRAETVTKEIEELENQQNKNINNFLNTLDFQYILNYYKNEEESYKKVLFKINAIKQFINEEKTKLLNRGLTIHAVRLEEEGLLAVNKLNDICNNRTYIDNNSLKDLKHEIGYIKRALEMFENVIEEETKSKLKEKSNRAHSMPYRVNILAWSDI